MYLDAIQLIILAVLAVVAVLVAYVVGRNDEYERYVKRRMNETAQFHYRGRPKASEEEK